MEECQNRIIAELRNEVDIADEKVRTARIEANRTATMYENEIRSEMFKNNRLLLKRERESFGMTINKVTPRENPCTQREKSYTSFLFNMRGCNQLRRRSSEYFHFHWWW